jgi:hypothetical protein
MEAKKRKIKARHINTELLSPRLIVINIAA